MSRVNTFLTIYFGYKIEKSDNELCKLIYEKYVDKSDKLYEIEDKDTDNVNYYDVINDLMSDDDELILNNDYYLYYDNFDDNNIYLIAHDINYCNKGYNISVKVNDFVVNKDEKEKFENLYKKPYDIYILSKVMNN